MSVKLLLIIIPLRNIVLVVVEWLPLGCSSPFTPSWTHVLLVLRAFLALLVGHDDTDAQGLEHWVGAVGLC